MLRFLSGKVVSVSDSIVVLDVAGFGFELLCTGRAAAMCGEGEPALLVTHLQFAETGPSLFGFADERERGLFLKLTTVKGVGGKMAMNILKAASSDRVIDWLVSSDIESLVKIPGIGRKTAERLCFEMHRHLAGGHSDLNIDGVSHEGRSLDLAMEGLRSLGFSQGDVAAVFRKLKNDGAVEEDSTAEQLIRMALKELKRN
ncbi:MAG: holliday junction helicase RuvA [Synergistaceae bacterium]|jgi:Holliday junction DNA helicase RuvA|nr:holliday junction helicase RuvA [Synergistaceae bacterium]